MKLGIKTKKLRAILATFAILFADYAWSSLEELTDEHINWLRDACISPDKAPQHLLAALIGDQPTFARTFRSASPEFNIKCSLSAAVEFDHLEIIRHLNEDNSFNLRKYPYTFSQFDYAFYLAIKRHNLPIIKELLKFKTPILKTELCQKTKEVVSNLAEMDKLRTWVGVAVAHRVPSKIVVFLLANNETKDPFHLGNLLDPLLSPLLNALLSGQNDVFVDMAEYIPSRIVAEVLRDLGDFFDENKPENVDIKVVEGTLREAMKVAKAKATRKDIFLLYRAIELMHQDMKAKINVPVKSKVDGTEEDLGEETENGAHLAIEWAKMATASQEAALSMLAEEKRRSENANLRSKRLLASILRGLREFQRPYMKEFNANLTVNLDSLLYGIHAVSSSIVKPHHSLALEGAKAVGMSAAKDIIHHMLPYPFSIPAVAATVFGKTLIDQHDVEVQKRLISFLGTTEEERKVELTTVRRILLSQIHSLPVFAAHLSGKKEDGIFLEKVKVQLLRIVYQSWRTVAAEKGTKKAAYELMIEKIKRFRWEVLEDMNEDVPEIDQGCRRSFARLVGCAIL